MKLVGLKSWLMRHSLPKEATVPSNLPLDSCSSPAEEKTVGQAGEDSLAGQTVAPVINAEEKLAC